MPFGFGLVWLCLAWLGLTLCALLGFWLGMAWLGLVFGFVLGLFFVFGLSCLGLACSLALVLGLDWALSLGLAWSLAWLAWVLALCLAWLRLRIGLRLGHLFCS